MFAKQSIILFLIIAQQKSVFSHTVAPIVSITKAFDSYSNNTIEKGLGLILRTGQIKVTKTLESNNVNVKVEVQTDPHYYDVYLKKLEELIKVKGALSIFTGVSRNSEIIKQMINRMERTVVKIATQLFVISQHSNTEFKDPYTSTSCRVVLEPIPSDLVESVFLDASEFMGYINDSITEVSLPLMVQDIIYYLYHTEVAIGSLLEQSTGRMKLLESLSSHEVSDDLPIVLQLQPCHDDINIEEITIKNCVNVDNGLSCQIELDIQKEFETVEKYSLINYQGVQLKLYQPDDILVKNNDGHFFLLRCYLSDPFPSSLDEYENCESIPYDNLCTEYLEQKEHFNEVLQNCNFSYAQRDSVISFEHGILIQEEVTWIKELHPVSRAQIGIIKNKVPVLIRSNALISIFHTNQLIIRPERQHSARGLNYTYLTDQNIEQLQSKASLLQIKEDIDRGDVVDIFMGTLLLIMTPGALYALRQCFSSGIALKNCCQFKRSSIDRSNYDRNRRVIRNPAFRPSLLGQARVVSAV